MFGWLKKPWRQMTNPWPMAGQMWVVDGVGRVQLTHVQHQYSRECRRGECNPGRGEALGNSSWHVHALLPGGGEVVWPGQLLVNQGYLWQPKNLDTVIKLDRYEEARKP